MESVNIEPSVRPRERRKLLSSQMIRGRSQHSSSLQTQQRGLRQTCTLSLLSEELLGRAEIKCLNQISHRVTSRQYWRQRVSVRKFENIRLFSHTAAGHLGTSSSHAHVTLIGHQATWLRPLTKEEVQTVMTLGSLWS